jgi:hypothetical protein
VNNFGPSRTAFAARVLPLQRSENEKRVSSRTAKTVRDPTTGVADYP